MKYLPLFLFLMIALPANAQNLPDLFFHEDEVETIEHELKQLPPTKRTEAKHLLHLDSILFINAKSWTIWMQGQKVTPEKQATNYRVFDVTPQNLRITAKLRNGHTITKSLAPHQSLNLLTGDVIEGGI